VVEEVRSQEVEETPLVSRLIRNPAKHAAHLDRGAGGWFSRRASGGASRL
jgi:hypothetical protein